MSSQQEALAQMDENETELVSEFPPPPMYYQQADQLTPPPIPTEALARSTKLAVQQRWAKEIEEKSMFGGGNGGLDSMPDFDEELSNINEVGPTVNIFGQEGSYVEDPDLIPVKHDCHDPQEVKGEVSRLNNEILKGFISLLGDLVNRPLDNEQSKKKLMENIELMLKECNKFREHQAREVLIETLEFQMRDRRRALEEIKKQIEKSAVAMESLERIQGKNHC
ncbi:hypothetical protein CTEN210_09198 [Chaetoceros tenuissimus]|uniref:Mediator of RNA polymerase II transcription subunit 7 n=1 Tax=Chaetoceros tenuissimus TaxID=426638 RepID=A0AAD3CUZ5_9STRA|nr:hypothetical protein CTEN210_09198 [Chaetoceros tenuissimus]